MDTILNFEEKTLAAQKELVGKKMQAPVDAYRFLEKLPLEQIAYLLAESNNSAALSKIRAYLHKWRPIRNSVSLVANELEAIGMPRGPKFDAIVEQVFAIQLTGRGKTPEDRIKTLHQLSGIKEAPKKKEKEKKSRKAAAKHHAPAEPAAAGKQAQAHTGTAAGKAALKAQHRERAASKHAKAAPTTTPAKS